MNSIFSFSSDFFFNFPLYCLFPLRSQPKLGGKLYSALNIDYSFNISLTSFQDLTFFCDVTCLQNESLSRPNWWTSLRSSELPRPLPPRSCSRWRRRAPTWSRSGTSSSRRTKKMDPDSNLRPISTSSLSSSTFEFSRNNNNSNTNINNRSFGFDF